MPYLLPSTFTSHTAVALGSNLGDRLANLRGARDRLQTLPGVCSPVIASSIYETAPVDCPPDAPAYLNAVLELDFNGPARTLLDALQNIEKQMGRPDKHPRNASRIIDLDILYFGDLILNNEGVIIPHPRLQQRRFVLQPLAEISPDLLLPGQSKTVCELLAALPTNGVRLIGEKL